MLMRIVRYCLLQVVLLTLIASGALVGADIITCDDEYDVQWVHRNPAPRLEILERAVKHYTAAAHALKQGDERRAREAAGDALKVIPEFAEAYRLLSRLAVRTGDERKARSYQEKYEIYRTRLSVLTEYEYLKHHIDRLQTLYKPSRTLDRIVLALLLCAGYGVIMVILMGSGIVERCSLLWHRFRRSRKREQTELPGIIVGEFPGDEPEHAVPWWLMVVLFSLPFLVSFMVSILCGAEQRHEILFFTFVPGGVIALVMFKVFFSDDEPMPPKGQGGMGR